MSNKTESWLHLFDGLDRALADDRPFHQQAEAVIAVKQYLKEIEIPDFLIQPLEDAIVTLIDVAFAKDKDGRPGPKLGSWLPNIFKGQAAAVVTALVRMGWPLNDAIKMVAKELRLDRQKFKNQRDNILRRCANPLLQEAYDDAMQDIEEELSIEDADHEAELVLQLKSIRAQMLKYPGCF